MNKSKLIGLGALTLVIALGLVFILSGPSDTEEKNKKSISEVMKANSGGVKCVQHVVMGELGDMDTTMYFDIDHNKLRLDSKATYKGHPSKVTHMVDDGQKSYV